MGQYIATARSNYFKVKDLEKFNAWAESRYLEVHEKEGKVMLTTNTENGDWPSTSMSETEDDWVDIDLPDELAAHLCEGEVAVMM
jgi:hypothetical protein